MFDSITNRGEYFPNFFLAEILPAELKKQDWKSWAEAERAGKDTPRTRLRRARAQFPDARVALRPGSTSQVQDPQVYAKTLRQWHDTLIEGLGAQSVQRGTWPMLAGDVAVDVPAVHTEDQIVVIECGYASNSDEAFDMDGAARLREPVEIDGKTITDGPALVSELFASEEPPRYVLLLCGAVVVLAARHGWGEGKYLAVDLDVAFERNDTKVGGELDFIASLFCVDVLRRPDEGGDDALAARVAAGTRHAEGVSEDLREGLRVSVELIANEVLARLAQADVDPQDLTLEPGETIADVLKTQSLRYLYRILFLLYAESRPELGIVPVRDEEYHQGYGLGRLGDLVVSELDGSAAQGFHFYESLDLLFRNVNGGRRDGEPVGESEGVGLRFEALRAELFEPQATSLISDRLSHPDELRSTVDTRLRNKTLHAVLRHLMLSKPNRKNKRGAGSASGTQFISYAQLSVNQLGAVYEGIMSYTGRIAERRLYVVAKGGDSTDGSWLIPAEDADKFDEDFLVTKVNPFSGEKELVDYKPGEFVYRLSGRDRQTSASYYTPESLTRATVKLAIDYRMSEHDGEVAAADVLSWRVCEPALGSGAFLNEAINQLAEKYLQLRAAELGERLDPEVYATELAKAKAYIALHNAYGVDLNDTAIELAEVSLWLNTMHPGLKEPWFGLHLKRGNSLVGARRAYYTSKAVNAKDWLKSAPVEHPFTAGALPDGAIHHFLLPAENWGAVSGEKEAKALAPQQAKALAQWRRGWAKKPTVTQMKRLRALAGRVEYLWDFVRRRLELSETEIARRIDVWGADISVEAKELAKEEVLRELTKDGGPYWRLKTLMDTWTALWFLPVKYVAMVDGSSGIYPQESTSQAVPAAPEAVDAGPQLVQTALPLGSEYALPEPLAGTGPVRTTPRPPKKPKRRGIVPLAKLEDWLTFAEALLGTSDNTEDTIFSELTTLADLAAAESNLAGSMGMDSRREIGARFPWWLLADDIAKEQAFFHWELDFAHVFADGGFDLQVGNPPWVRPDWKENLVLAERDPWFALADKPSAALWREEKTRVLADPDNADFYLGELAANTGMADFLAHPGTYPLLAGTRPDLYRGFMVRAWANAGTRGIAGLIHPGTHYTGKPEGRLRAATYPRLRLHGHFANERKLFAEVHHETNFGIHIYGAPGEISFAHISWIFEPDTLLESLDHDGSGPLPGIKHEGRWDIRPYRARVVHVDEAVLADWRALSGEHDVPLAETKLLYPVTSAEEGAIAALAAAPGRLADLAPRISSGYNEKTAKDDGLIAWGTRDTDAWSEAILQGPHFTIATPLAKRPNIPCKNNNDYRAYDLTKLPVDDTPRTNYVRACEPERFRAAQDLWLDHATGEKRPYAEFFRVAWRMMVPLSTERSLHVSLVPPGPSHINGVHSMSLPNAKLTAICAGYWASLPLDYYLRACSINNLQAGEALQLPALASDHLLTPALLLRTLRLNCLTEAYAPLWADLYEPAWQEETWAHDWPGLPPLGEITPQWQYETPLRTEYARRAALVELDALVAVMLGMTAEQLVGIYRARFSVLSEYESRKYFDAAGRQIARDFHARGVHQTKTGYQELIDHLDTGDRPPRYRVDAYDPDSALAEYEPFAPPHEPYYRADRETEMSAAHAEFSRRLAQAEAAT